MYYEVTIRRTVVDHKGNDRQTTERYICGNCELFAEAEQRVLEYFNGECDVTAIKRSPIREFANKPDGCDAIYFATITDTFVREDGSDSKMHYKVALYATSVANANKIIQEYMAQGLSDMECERIEKTPFLEVI